MSLAQRMHFLLDMFQMNTIVLVSVINHYHINGLHYFETPCIFVTIFERRDFSGARSRHAIVTYWPSTEPSIKRCTCVNKRKNSWSRWTLNNNITRARRLELQLEPVGDKISKWEPAADRGLWTLSDPRLSNPSQDEKEVLLWSEELGSICSSLSPSPTKPLTHNQHQPFRE